MRSVSKLPLADIRLRTDAVAMNRYGFFAYVAGVVGLALLTANTTINSTIFVYQYNGGISALGVVGWLSSSLGPLALSAFVWAIDRRFGARWLPHLIFLPSAIAIFREGTGLYYLESGMLADSMASGLALSMATVWFLFTLVVHVVAFGAFGVASLQRRVDSR